MAIACQGPLSPLVRVPSRQHGFVSLTETLRRAGFLQRLYGSIQQDDQRNFVCIAIYTVGWQVGFRPAARVTKPSQHWRPYTAGPALASGKLLRSRTTIRSPPASRGGRRVLHRPIAGSHLAHIGVSARWRDANRPADGGRGRGSHAYFLRLVEHLKRGFDSVMFETPSRTGMDGGENVAARLRKARA
jgi:hypothetical protein